MWIGYGDLVALTKMHAALTLRVLCYDYNSVSYRRFWTYRIDRAAVTMETL